MEQVSRDMWQIKDDIQAVAQSNAVTEAERLSKIRMLVHEGEDVSARKGFGFDFNWKVCALEWAAGYGRLDLVKNLLNDRADVKSVSRKGDVTALMGAAKGGHTEVVRCLLDAGADVNRTNEMGTTPLMWAARSGCVQTVVLLLSRGAHVNSKEQYIVSRTALMHAAECEHGLIVQVLLNAGADPNAVDNQGNKASDLTQDKEIGSLLSEAEKKSLSLQDDIILSCLNLEQDRGLLHTI